MAATLEHDCRDALSDLKVAMIDLYASVGADPARPQDVSRRFRLNKTLTWNLARLMQAPGGLEAIGRLPGPASIEKLLGAAEQRGASRRAVEQVRSAARRCEQVIEIHAGDRATLDLIIDGLAQRNGRALEASRKHAYLGNSGIYGVQARTRLLSCFVAPNGADADRLDLVVVGGYAGLRRLRPSVTLPIFQMRQWSSEGQEIAHAPRLPLEPGAGDVLLRDFMGGEALQIEVAPTDEGVDYILKPGPIGNRAAIDCYFGDVTRSGASRWRIGADTTGEFGATIPAPVETLLFDLIAHEDAAFALRARTFVYAHSFGRPERAGAWEESSLLPIHQAPVELPGSPPAIATPLAPRYPELVHRVFASTGWAPERFRGVRLEVKYPPLGSTVLLRFDLPQREAASAS
jgi:hypothetical protein